MARQTAIGKVLAEIDARIERLNYASEVLASMTQDGIASEIELLNRARALVNDYVPVAATTGTAPKPRRGRKRVKTAPVSEPSDAPGF